YPHRLASIRSEGQFNSIIYEQADSYRGTTTRWCVLMGKDDLREHQLTPGDLVSLVSACGRMDALTVCEFDLPAGSLLAYYPEANRLIGTERDPRSQTPAFKSVPVRIERAPR
ncbi:molybdopterin dinucleotide binding domain-containing protein, partial [Spirosoma soli]